MSAQAGLEEDSAAIMPRERRKLLSHLNAVLEVAFDKYGNPRTKNQERQGWGRLIVNAVEAASGVLKDSDIDDLLRRIERLEEVRP